MLTTRTRRESALRVFLMTMILAGALMPQPAAARAPASEPQQVAACPTSGDLRLSSGETCSLAAGSYTFDSITVHRTAACCSCRGIQVPTRA
jgi:hypothetical protein